MYKPVKNKHLILITNGMTRLLRNIVKTLSYPFHALFPKMRFTIPEFSPAKRQSHKKPKLIV